MAEAVIIAASILVLAAVLACRDRRRDELRDLVGRKVVVQLDDATIVGVLAGVGRDLVNVRDATAGVDQPKVVDGHLRIARASIRYVQAVGD